MTKFFTQPFFVRFSPKEQGLFAKRLSFLVNAGLPLLECLHVIRSQTKSRRKGSVLESIMGDVANGQFLSTSLDKHKYLFGDFTINLIRIGEQSGTLSRNLAYLAEELHKRYALKRKVHSALVYPLVVTVATLGLTAMLTVYIFPKIMPLFVSLRIELPLTTRVLLAVSSYLQEWGIVTIFGLAIFIAAFLVLRSRAYSLRLYTDRLVLAIPGVKSIVRTYNCANFCRTLGLLLQSGLPLPRALSIVADSTKNLVYRNALHALEQKVIKGESLFRSPLKGSLFPETLIHLASVGEKTGTLPDVLHYLAGLYESDVDEYTKNLSNSLEPILMCVLGLLVGLIAISIITPIYEITKHMQR